MKTNVSTATSLDTLIKTALSPSNNIPAIKAIHQTFKART